MSIYIEKIKILEKILRSGHLVILLREFRRRLYSEDYTYIIRKDIRSPSISPKIDMPMTFREYTEEDISTLLDIYKPGISGVDMWDKVRRIFLVNSGIKKCYVAITHNGTPCHINWLIGPEENEKLQRFYNKGFPELAQDEMLLEGGYTPEEYRGKGVMTFAYLKLPQIGSNNGTRWILSFIRKSNSPSLKAGIRAGFVPYMIRKETWRMFRRKLGYTVLPPGTLYDCESGRCIEP